MDTSDRHDPLLPARSGSPLTPAPRVATSFGGGSRELAPAGAAPPTLHVDPVGILRGLLRNWWKILGLWLIASAPLLYLIHVKVKPKYTAYSRLRIQPTQYELFGGGALRDDRTVTIQTEIGQMKTDRVLDSALADATVANLPFVKNSLAPRVDLLRSLRFVNDRDTNFVTISMDSTDPDEAAAIVNAVVASYLRADSDYKTGADDVLKRNFQKYLDEMRAKRKEMEDQLARLIDSGVDNKSLTPVRAAAAPGGSGGSVEDPAAAPAPDISQDQLRTLKNQLLDVQIDLLAARSRLESRTQDFEEGTPVDPLEDGAAPPEAVVAARVEAAFRSDPMIADLYAQKAEVEGRLGQIEKKSRRLNDPARIAHEQRRQELAAEIDSHWRDRYHRLREMVLAGGDAPIEQVASGEPRRKTVQELRAEVAELERLESSYLKLLADVEVESQQSNSATYRAQFLQNEIRIMAEDEKVVHRKLQDLMFRTNRELVRVELIDPAVPQKRPSDDKQLKMMAAAPAAVLVLIVGLFALLEIRAERVGDPDALSTRVHSQVYSLPPIPTARPRRLGAPGEDDQIDRFIQRLDHLRFAVCGDHPDAGLGRCVLISSAVGGEGKTTLAAQLAARCGHAGHSTLLIDADLRRGALCPLLDVAEGPGLSDVLMDEGLNVEDLVIPVQGGTFHLLSAGTPTSDTSRVFQGRTFGMLIARLRQLYDMIIIDSPPILPVPDALIMGRWTDGVVLTSRFDVSRAPQVERARRQLDLAGIPVLGTVINGMRASDSYYGRYSYSRQHPGPGGQAADATPTA